MARAPAALLALLPLAGCGGPQSARSYAGADAAQLTRLFWVMLAGAVVLWLLVNRLFFFVTLVHSRPF